MNVSSHRTNFAATNFTSAARAETSTQAAGEGAPAATRCSWSQLESQMQRLDGDTQEKIKFGMAIVNFVHSRQEEGHLGGSLVAKAFGGPRVLQDIDLDTSNAAEVKARFLKMSDCYFVTGNDVFKTGDVVKSNNGCAVQYRHLEVDREYDPMWDYEDLDELDFNQAELKNTVVDFTEKELFTGLQLDDDLGHAGPGFLIAAYLVRMDYNKADVKQVEGIVGRLKENGMDNKEVADLVFSSVRPKYAKADLIDQRLQKVLNNQLLEYPQA